MRDFLDEHRWLYVLVVLGLYGLILYQAWLYSGSYSGWIVWGWGAVLLADRLGPGWLALKRTASARAVLLMRLVYFLLGAALAALLVPGNVPWSEWVLAGAALALGSYLVEHVLELLAALFPMESRDPATQLLRRGIVSAGVLGGVLVIGYPLIWAHPVHRQPVWTPADLELEYEDAQLIAADGTVLRGWLIPAKRPKATVVYCHGYAEHRGQVLSLLCPLVENGFNVVAFDLRGHGQSQGHTLGFGAVETGDLQAICRLARRRFARKPVLLVGVSYGAALALQALPELEHVHGAWIDSSYARLDWLWERQLTLLPRPLRTEAAELAWQLVAWDNRLRRPPSHPIEALHRIRVPLAFCHWRKDPLTPFSDALLLYRTYQGPKEHYWIDRPLSWGLTPQGRRQYCLRLLKFLDRCLKRPAVPGVSRQGGTPGQAAR